jgi:hypothetical protein
MEESVDIIDAILRFSSEIVESLLEKDEKYKGCIPKVADADNEKGEWNLYMHFKESDYTPFYVGICKNSQKEKRPFEKSRRSELWKRTYRKHGRYVMMIQENISESHAKNMEKWLIHMYGKKINKNGPLVNITDGGEGFSGKHKYESKKKMSEYRTGRTGDMCPNSQSVIADGVRYGSIWEAAREIGVHGQTILNRCNNNKFKNYYKL